MDLTDQIKDATQRYDQKLIKLLQSGNAIITPVLDHCNTNKIRALTVAVKRRWLLFPYEHQLTYVCRKYFSHQPYYQISDYESGQEYRTYNMDLVNILSNIFDKEQQDLDERRQRSTLNKWNSALNQIAREVVD